MNAHGGDFVVVGRVVGTFGLRGDVKIAAADRAEMRPGLAVVAGPDRRRLAVVSARPHHDLVVAHFAGIDDVAAAQLLVNAELLAAKSDLRELAGDSFRVGDLVGLRVIDTRLGPLGKVTAVQHYPSCDMLVVGARRLLVPMLLAYCVRVDLGQGEITTTLPDGFEDI